MTFSINYLRSVIVGYCATTYRSIVYETGFYPPIDLVPSVVRTARYFKPLDELTCLICFHQTHKLYICRLTQRSTRQFGYDICASSDNSPSSFDNPSL